MQVNAWLTDTGLVFTRTDAPTSDQRGNGYYDIHDGDISDQDAVFDMIAVYSGESDLDATFVAGEYDTEEADLLAEYDGTDLIIHVETIIEETTDDAILSYFGIPEGED